LSDQMNRAAAVSRREFLRKCAATATLTTLPILGESSAFGGQAPQKRGPAARTFSLDNDWLFGGQLDTSTLDPHTLDPAIDDSSFLRVTLPPGRMAARLALSPSLQNARRASAAPRLP
jgi:hypothetical protein